MKLNKLIQNTDDFKIISFIGNKYDKDVDKHIEFGKDTDNIYKNISKDKYKYKYIDIDIKGISNDSRNISEGYLFAARKGNNIDSNKYIKDAVEKGASCILTDEQIDDALEFYINEYNRNAMNRGKNGISVIIVDDALKAYAIISRNFFNRPAMKLKMAGITGTNGKTTTSYLLNSILNAAGLFSGLIGTIDYKIAFFDIPSMNTTPDSYMLNDMLNTMVLNNLKSCVMEVSSHSLIQRRTYGIDFDIAIFTNLTRDHLDYHNDMESYYRAKKLFFTEVLSNSLKNKKYAVINNDDEYGLRLISELSELGRPAEGLDNFNIITYGLTEKADIFAKDIKSTTKGLEFKLYYNNLINKINCNFEVSDFKASSDSFFIVKSCLMGSFNVYNILAAAAPALALSVDNENISKGISALTNVPGRVEKIKININGNTDDSSKNNNNNIINGNTDDSSKNNNNNIINGNTDDSSKNNNNNIINGNTYDSSKNNNNNIINGNTYDSSKNNNNNINNSHLSAVPLVCVDYAHTDDALNRVLSALREITSDNLICVFGCGGDRDKGKRPMMGRHAGRLADITVITSDNPRSEDPMSIIKEIETGIKEENVFYIPCDSGIGDINKLKNEIIKFKKDKERRVHIYTIVPDREKAIKTALSAASSEKDTVLISGKGHEDYMIIGEQKIHFSDKEEVLKFYNLVL
jgi:UDP-N-acetylmuramyl-tripeptide synthetase